MNIKLHNKVELFLSQAEVIIFTNVDKDIIMTLNFPKEKYSVFSKRSSYEDMNAYFKGRNITLSIIHQDTYYRASLIDTKTGDSININNVNFVTGNLDQFVNGVPTDVKMSFFIYGFKKEGSDIIKIMQPIIKGSKPLIIHGYSYVYNQ